MSREKARAIWDQIRDERDVHLEEMATRVRDAKNHKTCMYDHASAYNRMVVKSCSVCGLEMCTFCGFGLDGKWYCDKCYEARNA